MERVIYSAVSLTGPFFQVIPLIPEAEMYGKLVEFEKRLDINIHKKKFDIHDALGRPQRVSSLQRFLRAGRALLTSSVAPGETDAADICFKSGSRPTMADCKRSWRACKSDSRF